MIENLQFAQNVYNMVRMIPYGKVTTYGRIAVLIGFPNHARGVGKALKFAPEGLPCHRVVNHQGRLAPGWSEQRKLLEQEGVLFKENGCVDLKRFLWRQME